MGKVIVFAQQKGGSGKTTVLAHLSRSLTDHGRSVQLVDLDPQRSLSQWASLVTDPPMECVESKAWRAGSDIGEAAAGHDLVLVDCPGHASPLLEAALRCADLVIVPCQPTGLDVRATSSVLEMAEKEGTGARVLLNRVPPRGRRAERCADDLRRSGARLLSSRLGNRVAYSSVFLDDTPARLKPGTKAFWEIEALREEIEDITS
ncbi:MAG: AAA family ATPase [Paracoccaceae bacterium]